MGNVLALIETNEICNRMQKLNREKLELKTKIESGYITGNDLVTLRIAYMEKDEEYERLKNKAFDLASQPSDDDDEDCD